MRTISGKKGLSPVIATVLLISLAIVLVGIVFLWLRGFIGEQIEKQGKPIDSVCANINFEKETELYEGYLDLRITNLGNIHIYGMDVKFIGGGESSLTSFKFDVPIGEASEVQRIPLVGKPEKVTFYPMVLGSVKGKKVTKAITCLDYGQTITL
jgi:flagellin-like protein